MRAVLHNPSPSIQRRQAPTRRWLAGFAAAILLVVLTTGTATAARPAANDPAALGLLVTAPRMGTAAQEPCAPVDLRYPDGKPIDLTGAWRADDGALYYLRQVGSCLWWAGLSEGATYATAAHPFWPLRWGLTFTNVFQGTISSGFSITGQWADVPRGLRHIREWAVNGVLVMTIIGEMRDGAIALIDLRADSSVGTSIDSALS